MKEKKSNVITTSDLKTNYLKTNLLKQIKKISYSHRMLIEYCRRFNLFVIVLTFRRCKGMNFLHTVQAF